MRSPLARLVGPGVVVGAMGGALAGLVLLAGAAADNPDPLSQPALLAMALAVTAAALISLRLPDRLSPHRLCGFSAAAAGAGLWAATTGSGSLATAGLVVTAAGFAPSAVRLRLLVVEAAESLSPAGQTWPNRDEKGHEYRYALFSWYWSAAALGSTGAFGLSMLSLAEADTILRIAGASAAVGGLVTAMVRLPRSTASDGVTAADAPWARRSIAAAFGLGTLLAGGAASGHALLVDEWQRSPSGAAGVMAAACAGAAVATTFGRWFHRLALLRGAGRAAAAGNQLMIGGGLAALGALSFTYVGLIASWAMAAGALALAAVALDAAVWSGMHPAARLRVAGRQVVGFALGAALAVAVTGLVLADRHDQIKIAATSLVCIAVGYRLARRRPASAAVVYPPVTTSTPGSDPAAAGGADRDAVGTGTTPAAAVHLPVTAADHAAPAWSRSVPLRVADNDDAGAAALLRLDRVGVAYDGVPVVFDASLTVREGQVVALLGTNGAGKTTTLRAVSGLEPVCSGRVLYRGLDITRTPPTWRVGMGLHQVVGGDAVAGELTVADNLRMFAHSLHRADADAGIAAAMDAFPRLAERRSQSAATLSGGEKQMLALAKAFIVSPRLLLIDEFSLGLAPVLVAELVPVVRMIAARGTSVLLVEQSVDVACDLADHAYVMEKGEIREAGSTADVHRISDLVRAVYLADSPAPHSQP